MTPNELAEVTTLIQKITLSPHNRQPGEAKREKVVIVAFGPTADLVTSFQSDAAYEIWCINNGYYNNSSYDGPSRLRADRWFEIHQMHAQPEDDLVWMNHCPVPLYVADLEEARKFGPMPTAIQYPYVEIEQRFDTGKWWACTFAYQIALAIHEGFKEIVLLGMEFGSAREWIMERPNVLWWAGLAEGMGIKVIIPEHSTLMVHPYRYGIEYDHEKVWCDQQATKLIALWGFERSQAGRDRQHRYEQGLREALPKETLKDAWRMTRAEAERKLGIAATEHRRAVWEAIGLGYPVPEDVLQEFHA